MPGFCPKSSSGAFGEGDGADDGIETNGEDGSGADDGADTDDDEGIVAGSFSSSPGLAYLPITASFGSSIASALILFQHSREILTLPSRLSISSKRGRTHDMRSKRDM